MLKLPEVADAARLRGLYIYDFGAWSAIGYTAAEIAILLEDSTYRGGKVYRIRRAYPNGQMEIKGVSTEQFELESGLFFYRRQRDAAMSDFQALCDAAESEAPPCRAYAQIAECEDKPVDQRYAVALIYPSEFEDDIAAWLNRAGFEGGDTVEGGVSRVTNYHSDAKTVLARRQFWSESSHQSRSSEEVIASVRRAIQR